VTRILGIDPGSRVTGYGVIDMEGSRAVHVASGCISVHDARLAMRLKAIFEGVTGVVQEYLPQEMAVEIVFMKSLLQMRSIRGRRGGRFL
jgi:crossover junction endodeoxyribonuclease RuvC